MNMGALLAGSAIVTTWITPAAIIIAATFVGWVVERLAVHWIKDLSRRMAGRRESRIARTVRGHITLWGFLLGVGLAFENLTTLAARTRPGQSGPSPLIFSAANLEWAHKGLLAIFVVSLTLMLMQVVVAVIVASAQTTARPVVSLVTNVSRLAVLLIGFLLILSVFGINLTPLLATLGVAGLAASLALQATLTDLVSGMILLASRQIAIGDYVKLNTGEEGYVSDITWRTTTIRQLSNNLIIVPNSKVTSTSVTNFHAVSQTTSVSVDVSVSYGADLEQVERVTLEVAQDVMRTVQSGVPDYAPSVRFNTLGDYSIHFSVTMQAQEVTGQYLIKHEFIKRLRARYREEGIAVPYPTQLVRLTEVGATGGAGDAAQASANSSEASSR
ncbi:MAG TPA: mechanosensitive ion channel family protein [Ktedonobacterales bacterium]